MLSKNLNIFGANRMSENTAIKLDPKLIMAASLIYMSSVDGTIAQQEWGQLKTVVGGDDKLLEKALDYVRETSVDEFLDIASSTLSKEQKICILFNVYDSLHSDEVAEPEELELFEKFLSKFSIEREEINQSLEAIFIKNNLAVLKQT
ncbi:MAG: hypothetical protein CBC01_00125 [Betaproteobacteria bacterium TMED41]|nr:MAG: hypothetical protein CBC01_00125 [Betaproteobacteria bacterium TMED41]|tara:strand:- start:32 stop:475 length:444 start_codon:yes stop_codon:yes gene_type:complete